MNTSILRLLIAWTVLASTSFVQAQTYPEHPVRIVVPFGAGGITDVVARLIAEKMSVTLNRECLRREQAGHGRRTRAGRCRYRAAGRDLPTVRRHRQLNRAVALIRILPYNLVRDFVAVTRVAEAVNVLCVNPKVPAKSIPELIALLKAKPDQLTYASSGTGGLYHLALEDFKYMTNTAVRHIPYRTEGEQRADVVAGRVDMLIDAYGVVKGNIDNGQLRVLAVTSEKRLAALPNVPTLQQLGLKGYDADAWVGLLPRRELRHRSSTRFTERRSRH